MRPGYLELRCHPGVLDINPVLLAIAGLVHIAPRIAAKELVLSPVRRRPVVLTASCVCAVASVPGSIGGRCLRIACIILLVCDMNCVSALYRIANAFTRGGCYPCCAPPPVILSFGRKPSVRNRHHIAKAYGERENATRELTDRRPTRSCRHSCNPEETVCTGSLHSNTPHSPCCHPEGILIWYANLGTMRYLSTGQGEWPPMGDLRTWACAVRVPQLGFSRKIPGNQALLKIDSPLRRIAGVWVNIAPRVAAL